MLRTFDYNYMYKQLNSYKSDYTYIYRHFLVLCYHRTFLIYNSSPDSRLKGQGTRGEEGTRGSNIKFNLFCKLNYFRN